MADPISNPDLSAPTQPVEQPPAEPTSNLENKPLAPTESGLAYEETPVIEPEGSSQSSAVSFQQESQVSTPSPIPEAPVVPPPVPMPSIEAPRSKGTSCLGALGTIILFMVLFGVGVWLSSVIRQYVPNGLGQIIQPRSQVTPAPTVRATPTPADPYASWEMYQVISSATRQSTGISFKLPSDVLSPICDGTSCMSQGTYLPGGTRFTVALRGPGMALRDFRGRVITDVNGTEFTTTDTTVVGRTAVNFTGNFSGRTVAGYAFTRMHGYMVEVSDTLSLEINHFTPAGITADFEIDHMVFESVIKSLTFEGYPVSAQKGAVIPTIAPLTTQATPSGY